MANHKGLVSDNYRRFCSFEGNEYIVSEYALQMIVKIIEKFQIHSILELGLGIGTIADTVLSVCRRKNYPLSYSGTEENIFCREALTKNIRDFSELELFFKLEDIPSDRKFDLIIIDGKEDLNNINQFCKPDSILLVEGDRLEQTKLLLSKFSQSKYLHATTLERKKPYAPGRREVYQGGLRILFLDVDLKKKLFRIKHKLRTYIIRYLRTYKN